MNFTEIVNERQSCRKYDPSRDVESEKLKAVLLDFFIKSSEIFGNMRSKEKLYSTLFHSEIISVADNVLRGVISDDDDTIYKITHSFIYGFAD